MDKINTIARALSRLMGCERSSLSYCKIGDSGAIYFYNVPGECRHFLGIFEVSEKRPKNKKIIDVYDGWYITMCEEDTKPFNVVRHKAVRKMIHAG
jgi:predicted RNA-binding protein with PUA-like domain